MGRKGRGTISVKGLQDQAAASLAQALERVRNTPICEDPRGEVSEAEVADARHAVATLRHSLVSLAALWDGRSPAPTPPVLESHLREVAAAGRALSTAASRCARSAGPTLHFWMRNLLASISEAAKQALASMGTLESRPDTLRRAVNLAMEACDAAERASWTNREVLARRLNGVSTEGGTVCGSGRVVGGGRTSDHLPLRVPETASPATQRHPAPRVPPADSSAGGGGPA